MPAAMVVAMAVIMLMAVIVPTAIVMLMVASVGTPVAPAVGRMRRITCHQAWYSGAHLN